MGLAVDFISAAAGGPTLYRGRDMKTAHARLGIDAEDYAAFKRHLEVTLDNFKVPPRETNEVMAFISSFEAQIVEK
jgi:hemoglobin